jgi:hypothetical protein
MCFCNLAIVERALGFGCSAHAMTLICECGAYASYKSSHLHSGMAMTMTMRMVMVMVGALLLHCCCYLWIDSHTNAHTTPLTTPLHFLDGLDVVLVVVAAFCRAFQMSTKQ